MSPRDQVYEMLRTFDTTMLVTVGGEHQIHARPMAIAEVEEDGAIWLLTSASSRKIDEITEDARTLLVCGNGHGRQLSISGRGRVVVDPGRVRRLWKEPYRAWFPEGPDVSDIALLAIDPLMAEFWDASGANRVAYFARLGQAVAADAQ
ncbi:MAG TPA: pyridoxamine 5'-phosphate oxidase family protein [Vicinamibacterales bacterium]|nr:pyridoxamine 5'-phosphate oxidase family protein [Vicinamibacterales bacterium]